MKTRATAAETGAIREPGRAVTDSPAPTIPPCTDEFHGRRLEDWCHDCHHVLAVHRRDKVCSVCDGVAERFVDIERRLHALEAATETP